MMSKQTQLDPAAVAAAMERSRPLDWDSFWEHWDQKHEHELENLYVHTTRFHSFFRNYMDDLERPYSEKEYEKAYEALKRFLKK